MFDQWEAHLVSRGYGPVYFDGVNRFYLHRIDPELRSGFGAPPNILDNFILTEAFGFARGLAGKIAAAKAETQHFSAHAASRDLEASKRSEEHTSELQSLMRTSYAVFCLKNKNNYTTSIHISI